MKKIISIAAVVSALFVSTAFAEEIKVGDLVLSHPYAKATPPGAPVSGGYLTIMNGGGQADRLVSANADFAGKTEVHEMRMEGDVMQMRQLADGLEIPAGGEVRLMPGGYHIMFMQLKEQLQVGDARKVTLTFEKAGNVDVDFTVEEVKPPHGGMKPGNMKPGG